MTISEAAKQSKWIRRGDWPDWINLEVWLKNRFSTHIITVNDITANDWVPYYDENVDPPDDSQLWVLAIELE